MNEQFSCITPILERAFEEMKEKAVAEAVQEYKEIIKQRGQGCKECRERYEAELETAKAENAVMREALEDLISQIECSRPISIGSIHNAYEVQIFKSDIKKAKQILSVTPGQDFLAEREALEAEQSDLKILDHEDWE